MTRESSQWLPLIVVAVIASGAIACSLFVDRQAGQPSAQNGSAAGSQVPDVAVLPEVPDSGFLNTSSTAVYVGSQACTECHSDQAHGFNETRHSRSMSEVLPASLPEAAVAHPVSGFAYATRNTDQGLVHSESLLPAEAELETREVPLRWAVGSGRFGYSFLAELDGYVVQSPLTWYSTRRRWEMSPGFQGENQLSFRRAVARDCLYCHAGIVETPEHNPFQFTVRETAIGCERCHGPGSPHVDFHSGRSADLFRAAGLPEPGPDGDRSIVNLARLERSLAEAVCQQCHVQGDVQANVRGREIDDWRPGQPLSQFRQEYRMARSDAMTIVGHVEQLHRSACYQASDSLTCTTCHDPHHEVQGPALDVHFRTTCLKCHAEVDCGEVPAVRQQQAGDRCVQCHMPAAETEVPHVAFTHHRIGLHGVSDDATTATAADPAGPAELLALLPPVREEHDDARCRGLALLRLYASNTDASTPATLKTAHELLVQAWNSGVRDAATAAALAQIAREYDDVHNAVLWSETALELEPRPTDSRMSALLVLAEVNFGSSRYRESLGFLTELTEHRRNARFWFFRGLCEQNLSMPESAVQSLQMSLAIHPRHPGTHSALAVVCRSQGNEDLATRHEQLAGRLSPLQP